MLYKSYLDILAPDADLEDLCLDEETFVMEVEKFGKKEIIELIPHGDSIKVTKENIKDWVYLILFIYLLFI